jgi:hypothetical protein
MFDFQDVIKDTASLAIIETSHALCTRGIITRGTQAVPGIYDLVLAVVVRVYVTVGADEQAPLDEEAVETAVLEAVAAAGRYVVADEVGALVAGAVEVRDTLPASAAAFLCGGEGCPHDEGNDGGKEFEVHCK